MTSTDTEATRAEFLRLWDAGAQFTLRHGRYGPLLQVRPAVGGMGQAYSGDALLVFVELLREWSAP
jgi:hypothetical protein